MGIDADLLIWVSLRKMDNKPVPVKCVPGVVLNNAPSRREADNLRRYANRARLVFAPITRLLALLPLPRFTVTSPVGMSMSFQLRAYVSPRLKPLSTRNNTSARSRMLQALRTICNCSGVNTSRRFFCSLAGRILSAWLYTPRSAKSAASFLWRAGSHTVVSFFPRSTSSATY